MPLGHAAINAWEELQPECAGPDRVEVLEVDSRDSAVYRLVRVGREGSDVIAKRSPQRTALTERMVYEEILPNLSLSMLYYYGAVKEASGNFWWLFLEDVSGDERYQPHIKAHRVAAARWLGVMSISAASVAVATQLPDRGPEHYLQILRSAHDKIAARSSDSTLAVGDRALLETIVAHCGQLSENWRELVHPCEGMPRTLVHGDLIRKNVAVRARKGGLIFLPFDWEKAGWGTPAEDISRVDIPTYWSIVQARWPALSLRSLDRLAHVGKIFRCLVFLDWIARSARGRFSTQALGDLRRCETWLRDLTRRERLRGQV